MGGAAGRGGPGGGAGGRRVSPQERGRRSDLLSYEHVLVGRRRPGRGGLAQRDAGAAHRTAVDAGRESGARGDAVAARGGGEGGAVDPLSAMRRGGTIND